MNRRIVGLAAVVLVAGGAAGAIAFVNVNQARAQGYQGYGGHGCPGMMGPGMMRPGMMGPGMMGRGDNVPQANLNLSADDVKTYLERWVAATGNPRIKPGRVAAVDSDTITADVVTVDGGALVQRFSINRHTGYWQEAE